MIDPNAVQSWRQFWKQCQKQIQEKGEARIWLIPNNFGEVCEAHILLPHDHTNIPPPEQVLVVSSVSGRFPIDLLEVVAKISEAQRMVREGSCIIDDEDACALLDTVKEVLMSVHNLTK